MENPTLISSEPKHKICFGEFELDVGKRRLRRGDEDIVLTPKAFDLLVFMTENAGRVLTKDEILVAVWTGQIVEEANLAVQISALRKALQDTKKNPRFFLTLPGKGYEFIGDARTDQEMIAENQSMFRLTIEQMDGSQTTVSDVTRKSLPPSKSAFILPKVAAGIILLALVSAAFWFWRSGAKKSEFKMPELTRLTTSGKVSALAITPDSHYTVFSQKEVDGESLWLRHLDTGSQTRIAGSQNLEYLGLTVSPDGKFIYASVFLDNLADVPLWRIPILGGAPQEIPNVQPNVTVSFSPDGKRFSYIEAPQSETHLKIADADGANVEVLSRAENNTRVFPFWGGTPTAWSPDGETIAAGYKNKDANGTQAGILLVNLADKSERILVAPQWNSIEDLTWLDAENLAFIAYEDEWTNQIYTVSRSSGEVRRITNDLQKYRFLATSGGELLTGQINAVSKIYLANWTANTVRSQPREIFRESGYITNVAWSKDDDAIFYSSRMNGKPEIWRVEADGTNAAQLTSDANINFGLTVAPSDGSLIFCAKRGGIYSIWKADENGKNPRPITDGTDHFVPDVASDGKIVFQSFSQKIWRVSPVDKKLVELHRGLKPAISPDSKQIAFFMMDGGKWHIGLISTETGEFLRKIELPKTVNQRRMRWHPSGKFLTLFFNSGENLNLLVFPVNGGKPQIVEGFGAGNVNSFDWSADGKQIVYSLTNEICDVVQLSN